jgi:hypothetical protein
MPKMKNGKVDLGCLTQTEYDLLARVERTQNFEAVRSHLLAVRAMMIDSDLDANDLFSLLAGTGFAVLPVTVQNVLSARHVARQAAQSRP